jgi:hypothetical protein
VRRRHCCDDFVKVFCEGVVMNPRLHDFLGLDELTGETAFGGADFDDGYALSSSLHAQFVSETPWSSVGLFGICD